MTSNWFIAVATIVFVLMMIFPLAIWKRCGRKAHRLLKNDPAFGFFTPLIFPVAMGVLAMMIAEELTRSSGYPLRALLIVFAVFASLAALLIHADMKLGPLEPYMLRDDEPLLYEKSMRRKLHALYREIHTGDLSADQAQAATAEISGLQREAIARYSELAAGFRSWRDVRERGTGVAVAQIFVNSIVAAGCAALFSWLLIAISPFSGYKLSEDAANASMICVGLLMLWFPLRLYSEWYAGFYSFRALRDYKTFWFLSIVAVVGTLLIAILLNPGAPLSIGLTAFSAVLMAVFGLFAKLKPQVLGYAAVVFEEMPLFPYLLTLIIGIFAVLLAVVLSATTPG